MDLPTGTSGRSALEVAKEAAHKAGQILVESFYQAKKVTYKSRGNIVTDVDVMVESEVRDLLRREFPEFGFLGEESVGDRVGEGCVWIVDPLDGTRNYASGIPFFSLVIGLAHHSDVLLGINYDPMRQEMFLAQKGKGAFLNGQRIAVSGKTALEECILGFDLSYSNEGALNAIKVVEALWPGMQSARVMGSSALGLSYAAAGRIDLYFHHQLQPWDIVAGLLLVREAGGVITDRNGGAAGLYSNGLIASSATLHAEFLRATEGLTWRMPRDGGSSTAKGIDA